MAMNSSKQTHIHLVSDSTGETVSAVSRAAVAQFENLHIQEHMWSLVRTQAQMEKVLGQIASQPGPVLYTVVNRKLREFLKAECLRLDIPCIPVLVPILRELSAYFGEETTRMPGRQHELNDEYFSRIEAINYTLAHDDGQVTWDLNEADIVLVGVSRTSKSPTCIYLAYRGLKAANVPYVSGVPMPETLSTATRPMIVGLTINPERLVEIRKTRLTSLNQDDHPSTYVDMEKVIAEVEESKRYFRKHGWPVINVTHRSVEETAANVFQYFQRRQEKRHAERSDDA